LVRTIYFLEEDLDPARNLPRSMIGTALSCIVIFLLVNAALFHVLRMDHLAGSQMPAADAAMLVFGRYGKQIILLISLVAVISTINAGRLYTRAFCTRWREIGVCLAVRPP
jgi:basic amino acid/polyamine antiporter, APA family